MKTEDTEALGRQRAKPIKIKAQYSYQPVRTAHAFGTIITVHNTVTQTVLFIFPFLQTNITFQMWPSEGKEEGMSLTCHVKVICSTGDSYLSIYLTFFNLPCPAATATATATTTTTTATA